ncbi:MULTISPECIES: hypothetical protein [Streptomyces]|uniref:hypothetical protein n=1 Tax=Streptomyces TaxID=1883 RepID=UPI00131DEBF9
MALDISGKHAGVAGELEGELLQVAGGEGVLVTPGEDGLDEALVRFAIEREPGVDQAVGVVQDRVGAGVHGWPRCREHRVRVAGGHQWGSSPPPAPSSWSWSCWPRKRA